MSVVPSGEPVAVGGPVGHAVAGLDLGFAGGDEVFEVAACADAGESGAVADFLGGQVVLGGAQGVDDEFEGDG